MEIIAHRGASGYAPENTMAAFEKALEMGAEAVEFDVQMSSDGELVIIHDDTLHRTTGKAGLVTRTPYSEMLKMDAGSWFAPEFANQRIPLLKDVLALLKGKVHIHLEIKKIAWESRPIERIIYNMVTDMGMGDQVIYSSFDHKCLLNLSALGEVSMGVLVCSDIIEPWHYMNRVGLYPDSFNQAANFVTYELVENFHERNMKLLSYTVNDSALAEYFLEIGVDGIFTNYPDILI